MSILVLNLFVTFPPVYITYVPEKEWYDSKNIPLCQIHYKDRFGYNLGPVKI